MTGRDCSRVMTCVAVAVTYLLLGGPLVGTTAAARGAILEVVVGQVRPGRGEVRVTVCTAESFLRDHCEYNGRAPANAAEVVVRIDGVPAGTWAVQAYQDEERIGRIPRNFLGIPRVGIGFSNDAPFRFGPPRFADAAFRLTQGGGRIRLNLRYFD